MTLSTPDTIPSITATIADALVTQCRVAVTANGNSLVIPDDIGSGELTYIIARLGAMQGSTERLDAVLRYNIGRAVLALAASGPEKRSPEEVIDEANLPELLGRSPRTVANWAYVARVIPPEELRAVSWTVLAEAAAAPPKDPAKALEWREERQKLLEDAAANPDEVTAKTVRQKVKQMATQLKGAEERPVRESVQELLGRYAKLARLLEVASPVDARRCGFESTADVRDKLTAVENDLVNRDALSPDPCAEIFYWVAKSADVDANEKTHPIDTDNAKRI
jgi:hypothetical protein